jgi:hypothetical protein
MLASIPASILNHIRRRTGIPPDSIKPGNALVVSFQEVVHSALAEETEVAEASESEGRTEWTPIRMRL